MSEPDMQNQRTGLEAAVIGMVCRFPGAGNIDGFWENLINARESTAFFSDEEMEKAGVEPLVLKNPTFVKAYGWIEDIEFFDYSFFGYTPLEAEVMDPQTCILHECAVEALENAGYNAYSYLKLIGIYVGASSSFEWQARSAWSGKNNILGWFPAEQLNDKDYLATRIAHKLNLKGPAVTVDTACSTAMTALHLAYQGLLSGDCDMALAGGVSIRALDKKGYLYVDGMLNSPDGHCRAFDARAKGSNFGNGAGLVVLKRLSDALADGDTIHAVIKGSSLNNDGTRKAGYTAPSIEGQAQVIRTAHQMAEVEPESISYVETHGTGTELGDPVEIEGLKAAFNTEKKHFCRIGSVKTNIGHLEAAAGAAGFIKTVLVLKHRLIPPSLFFEKSNLKIDFENSPFVVNKELTEWKPGPYPRRAGVSSFGIGGTNAHMVLEEWPQDHPSNANSGTKKQETGREFFLVLLSAKTETALERMTQNLAQQLKRNPGINLADTAYTLQVGRPLFKYRRMLVSRDAPEVVQVLSTPDTAKLKTFLAREDNPPIVFMFSGLGGQYVKMGRDLYEHEPLFRQETDRCFEILKPLLNFDIKEIIYPSDKSDLSDRSDRSDRSDIIMHQTEVAQLAVFILEHALAQLLIRWGIKPDSMIGYSFGEYTVACTAGVFSLEEALKVLAARGQLLRRVPAGVMLSVPLTREELKPLLSKAPGISLAIDNGLSCIIAGDPGVVGVFEQQMKKKRLLCTRLPQSHALHSSMMTPILAEFQEIMGTITLNKPAIPYISNVTGHWIADEEATSPTYWARHLGETVQFARGMRELLKDPGTIFMEIGPGRDISTLVMRYIEDVPGDNYQVLNLVRHPYAQENMSDLYFLLTRLGKLWLYGKPIDWSAFYAGKKRQRIPLPTYPFERESCWLPINPFKIAAQPVSPSPKSQQEPELADWYYIPSWTPQVLLPQDDDTPVQYHWWVFSDRHGLGALLAEKLEQAGHEVITVEASPGLVKKDLNHYMINPTQREDYHRLFRESGTRSNLPNRILHLWGVTGTGAKEEFEKIQESGLYSLLYIADATRGGNVKGEVQIDVVTDQLQEVTGEEELCPSKATIIGPVRVIPQEFPGIRCRSIDVVLPPQASFKETQLLEQLVEEILTNTVEPVIALRGNTRWIQTFQPLRLDKTREKHLKLREKGVYLITGGLGNIGLMLADYLARKVKAKLILTGRSPIPPRQEWEQWLQDHDETDVTSQKIKRLEIIENAGAEIRVFSLDTANKQKMQMLISRVENELGPVNGVIHAAGIMTGKSFAPIQQLEIAHCREQFRPKVKGLLILEELFREREPDFFWLLSSISVVLGGLGITAYAAANSYMDALAQQLNRTQPGKWISVDWDGMDSEKTQVSFERILSLGKVTRVVASNGGNLQERIHRWVELGFLEEENKSTEKEIKRQTPRPDLMSPYVAPETPVEKTVAGIFQNMFGYDRIGINDDFFELGLDSIKAIRIRVLMNKKGYDIELPDFFNYSTISKLVPLITTAKPAAIHPESTITGETFEQLKSRYPYPVQDIYPITPMQEGMLFHSLYETQNIQAYLEQFTFRLQGDLKVSLVEKSVNELAGRHDILRTAFVHEDMERPVQVVLKERTVDFFYKDLCSGAARDGHEKEAIIKEYIEKEKQHYFDLSKDKLMRLTVIQREEDEYIFVLTYHHILMDGWSLGIFISEFFEIYNSYIQNKTYRLPPTRPFRTYIDWIESKNKTDGKNFWKTYLEGYEEIASIPKKKRHKAKYLALEDKYTAGLIETILEKEKTQRLHHMAACNHVTLNTVFQSVWSIVLAAYSGKLEAEKAEVVFGSVVSGRPSTLEGVDHIVGCFINTIPVRVGFNYRTTFKQLLEEVQAKAIHCEPYHYYSLAEIQNQSPLKQNLLDHFLEFQNFPTAEQIGNPGQRTSGNDTVETYDLSNFQVFEQGNYEFVFSINPGDRLSLNFNYNTNAYDSDLIARLGRHTLSIIDQVARDEEIFIGKITLLTEAEKRQVLFEFNHKGLLSWDCGICQLLEKRAASHPDWTAVDFGDKWLTYGLLMELSRRLAVYLQRCGIQKDRTVGILMERSLTMTVSILGVWKAGGAYIPLEPQEPLKRITGILQDSGTTVLITPEEPVNPQLQEAYQGKIIQFNGHIDGAPLYALADVKANPDINRLAYVIYTSGSTGTPKGAMIEHRGMMNHIGAKIHELKITENSVIAQNASHTFDISVWQFYAALVPGGRTVIYPNPMILEPRRFLDQVIKNRVTILEVVPSYLVMILDSLDTMAEKERFGAFLEYLLVTGEEIQPSLIKRWRERYPGIKMVNAYGPTEASDDITHYLIDTPPGEEPTPIPIGKPLQNLKIYIINPCMQLCPLGVKGEICVSGIGVGRGYLNDPDRTHQAFMKDPFAQKNGLKLYKTGDLGLWLPDGTIEFSERKDSQVKVRGFRVELGEIENRLLTHGKIKEAVVMVREDNNDKYLCAYMVAKTGEKNPIDQTGIREYLTNSLPDYMVPAYFVQLDQVPLTPNGKVDRKSLPAPVPETVGHYKAPRDHIEKKLVGLWSEILELENEKISIDANFFHLGGHSIKAMVLASRIHKEFNINVPLSEIFKTSHIHGLAAYIKKSARSVHLQVEPAEKKEYYPLSSAQRRLYILQQMDAGKGIAYNIPSVWQLEGEISKGKLQRSFQQLIQRHEDLRTFFTLVNNEPVQRIKESKVFVGGPGGRFFQKEPPWPPEAIIKNFIRPFDLSQAPLLRMEIIHTSTAGHPSQEGITRDKHILMVDMHHIISDGLSMGILVKDFIEIYAGMNISGLKLQYKDFSQWQNRQARSEFIKHQETYWLNQLSGEIPVLDLPTDYPRPAVQDFTGAAIHFEIGKKETTAIKSLARQHDVTLFMLLLSVYTVFLCKLSGQEDVVVGTPIVGRRHTDLQGIIGMFVNTLVLRNFPAMEKTFGRFLDEIKENTIKAFENQDYQYEELVERVKVVRDTSRNPLFDTMFTLQNMETPTIQIPQNMDIQMPGLKVVPYNYESRISKFDLTLIAVEIRDGLAFTFEYCTKLFKPETIRRFIFHFNKTISFVCDNQYIRISEIEIIGEQEKNRILHEFNDTAADYPKDKTIQRLFKEQVDRTPDNIALHGCMIALMHGEEGSITYKELNEKSIQLAHMLIEKGVKPDTIVGIMIQRSVEMIIGILGILTAGCAYLPIEIGYPQERIEYMLKDSGAKILLTGQAIADFYSPQVFKIPPESTPFHLYLPPLVNAPAMSLAYIIYTSGSTGKPKGVLTTHANVTRVVKNTNYIHIEPGDRLLQLSNYAFDGSVFDIYGALLNGAELVLITEEQVLEIRRFMGVIKRQGITVFFVTTALFNMLVEVEIGCFQRIRKVLFGGERVSVEHSAKALEHLGKGRIIHVYGPTETTVYATYYFINTIDAAAGNIPIGKPISNTTVYILGKNLKPVLIGVTAELYIGGTGVARGYLNNPELTAEKFCLRRPGGALFEKTAPPGPPRKNFLLEGTREVALLLNKMPGKEYMRPCNHASMPSPHHFTTHHSPLTLYRTGDLTRWLSDGNIEFMGRIDQQVKIRGFRIELGEIESQLMRHMDIKEAVVLVQTYENGGRYLCAYITAEQDLPLSGIRGYLLDHLPGYMIPSEFVLLEKIPLTNSGKLDRQKLKSAGKRLSTGVEHVAPQSANEVIIAEAWKNVLKLEEVGIYDNFFDMGGTSLDMIRLNSKLMEIFNREIPIIAMYRYTTIDTFARFLEGGNGETENNPTGTRSKARVDRIKKGMEDKNKRREIRTRRKK